MAVAVPRQFEIAKTAAKGTFTTKKALATELERFSKRMIREGRISAFQKVVDNQRFALKASTISSYVSVAEHIGILDETLRATGAVNQQTSLKGFVAHLQDCLLPFVKSHGFSLDLIRDFLRAELQKSFPIEPVTPQRLYTTLNPNMSEFTFNQCLVMLDELFPTIFRVRSVRTLLHKNALWGGS